ncbi:4'-phosphopantetheinyl transferase superfamily protein [Streptomyces sp. NBC_00726]|uniref:4'-phosphopantetheinyl transferase family protein n=1 Tax=Streptomyces sp. NBC_00726 TaxID=2903674 RepID=UPI00386AAC10
MLPEVIPVLPGGPWEPVGERLRRRGVVVVAGPVAEWARPGTRPGRHVLARTVGAVLGIDPEAVGLGRSPGGRPYVRAPAAPDISLSHTRHVVVAALSTYGRIGVDVEGRARKLYGGPIVDAMTTRRERTALLPLSPAAGNACLVRLWTLKEAYAKALGVGTRLPFTAFGFHGLRGGGGRSRPALHGADGTPAEPAEQERWELSVPDDCVPGHVVSWAVRGTRPGDSGLSP